MDTARWKEHFLAAAFFREERPGERRQKVFCSKMLSMSRLTFFAALMALVVSPSVSQSQRQASQNCTYQTCALGLAPVWDGLAVTRGDSERRVATLGFFLPGDVSSVFEDDPDALEAARDAVQIRQIGAALTDGGLLSAATGIARALFRRDWDRLSTALTIGGAAALGVSIPVQFAADGELSRAVWLYNRRFAR